MIIPIGHEHETVRRLPWVSFVIIGINILVFLLVGLPADKGADALEPKLYEILEYWQSHTYLDKPVRILEEVLPPKMAEDLNLMVEAAKTFQRPPEDRATQEAEQHRLDALVDEFFRMREHNPYLSWGLIPASLSPLAFLTCMFMHGGWLHLIGNMFLFYLSGPFVEDRYGRPLFAGLYMGSGIAASLAHVIAFPSSDVPLIGASGAIAGVMGVFFIRFLKTKIRFLYVFFLGLLIRTGTFTAPAWLMLPLWVLQQVFYATLTGEVDGVAYWAHVGGFVFGAAAAYGISKGQIEEKYIHPKIEAQISLEQHPALEQGLDLLARGDLMGARTALAEVLAAEPRNPDANLAWWQCHVEAETAEEAAPNMLLVVDHEVRSGELGLALEYWRELVHRTGQGGPAGLRFRLASQLEQSDPVAAMEVLRHVADDPEAELLCEKAARKLANLAGSDEEREYWAARARGELMASPTPPSVVDPLVAVGEPAQVEGPGGASGEWSAAEGEILEEPALAVGYTAELAVIERFDTGGLILSGAAGGVEVLPYSRVKAVAVAGIKGEERPYLVLDLILRDLGSETGAVVRFRSIEINPRRLIGNDELTGLEAFRELVRRIAAGAQAPVLPSADVLQGSPFVTFSGIEEYEQQVLAGVD